MGLCAVTFKKNALTMPFSLLSESYPISEMDAHLSLGVASGLRISYFTGNFIYYKAMCKEGHVVTGAGEKECELTMILGGGGINAAFIAGAADQILNRAQTATSRVDSMVGVSGSVGNVIYYLAHGADHPGKKVWTHLLTDKRFMHFESVLDLYKNRPLYDLDFMVETIFKQEVPIDQNRVKNHKIVYFFPLQNIRTNKVTYFSNLSSHYFRRDKTRVKVQNISDFDLYEIIKAASAAPILFDRSIKLGDSEYIDAASIDPIPIDIPNIKTSKKIIILTRGKASLLLKIRYLLFAILFICLVAPFKSRRLDLRTYLQYGLKPFLTNKALKEALRQEKMGQAVVIYPTKKIGGLLNNDPERLAEIYKHGENIALARLQDIEKMIASGR